MPHVISATKFQPDVFRNAIIGMDSLIYAIDLTQGVVVAFDSAFGRVRVIHANDGGRFSGPYTLGVRGDTLWVSDVGTKSVALFAHGSKSAGVIPNTVKPPTVETYFEVSGIAPSGDLWLDEGGSLSSTGTIMRDGRAVALASRGDSTAHEITRLAARDLALILPMPNGHIFVGTQPWTSTDLFDLASNSSWMARVKRFDTTGSVGDSTIVELFDGSGRLKWHRAFSFPHIAISDSLIGMAQSSLVTSVVVAAYGSVANARRAIREVLYVPDSLPAISQVVVSGEGRVWLAHTATTGTQLWTILDSDGAVSREIGIPADIHVVDVSNRWIIGIREDRDSRYQLVRLSVR
ncbi:MAG: hypothetical protein ABI035_15050 [Gemmatimonadaceae bacterium]